MILISGCENGLFNGKSKKGLLVMQLFFVFVGKQFRSIVLVGIMYKVV